MSVSAAHCVVVFGMQLKMVLAQLFSATLTGNTYPVISLIW
jgi:hypothetical protein